MEKHCVRLYSEAGEALARDHERIPWDAYPRPHLERDSYFSLNGWWHLLVTPRRGEAWKCKIRVPFAPQALLSGVERAVPHDATLSYTRDFTLATLPDNGDRILLHIDAADHAAVISLNGARIGGHAGGYDPICLDITDHLAERNRLRITVMDDDTGVFPCGKQRSKRGGMWYTPVSGIWQSVWLERVPATYISDLCVYSDTRGATLMLKGNGALSGSVTLHLEDKELHFPVQDGAARIEPPQPHLWSPEDPYLYRITVNVGEDSVRSYFALRSVEIREHGGQKCILLNGKPYFFHGLLDQGYYSDGHFLPATPTGYEQDILQAKRLGFNTLRKHIKVEPERFYYDSDRLGIIVFQDMVSNGGYAFLRDTALPTLGFKRRADRRMHRDTAARAAFTASMEQTVRRLAFHPCVCYWTIFNEGWGQFDHAAAYARLLTLDGTRVIDSVSGWFLPRRGNPLSDVESPHVYFKRIKLKMGRRPVVLSEFGGYSHRVDGHCFNLKKNYGYRTFKERDAFEQALLSLYETEVLPAVQAGLCGAIYTQLSDVEDETNGLLTFDRRVCKVDEARMREMAEKLYHAGVSYER